MGKQTVTVKGKREVAQAFSRLSNDLDDVTDDNREMAQQLVSDVRRKTRTKTGELARGWIAEGDATRIKFNNNVSYAPIQEFGSEQRGIDPTNAVRRTFEENRDAITDGYGRAVNKRAKRRNIDTKR